MLTLLTIGLAGASAAPAGAAKGKPGLIRLAGYKSHWKVLIPVDLPLISSGQKVSGRVTLGLPRGSWNSRWEFIAHSGPLRLADRRGKFRFVKGVAVPDSVARAVLRNPSRSTATLRVDYDLPTADSNDSAGEGFGEAQVGIPRAKPGDCETVPRFIVNPARGKALRIGAPTCGRKLNWRIAETPENGTASSSKGRILYRPNGQTGADEVVLEGYLNGRLMARQRVQLRLSGANPSSTSVIAMGDSVTASFGYFGATGKQMGLTQLDSCRPGATFLNDACSSNSYNRNSSAGTKPNYLPDYGLSRNVSWAAQWANEYGITDYRNYAVTGSAPSDWLPGGQFNSTLTSIESQNPDYILMTIGANPLLSDVLFDIDTMGCALESDLFGDFRQCVLDAFEAVDLDDKLNQLYTSLVDNTTSQIVLMQYPLTIPAAALAYSAVQLEQMESLLDGVIADEAAQVSTSRISVIAPPRFNVGIDMTPMYPSKYSCSFLGYEVDGPSVQATISQDALEVDHPLSFCSGPSFGAPWVISGDTGIHPSASGYSQMAGQIPAPGS